MVCSRLLICLTLAVPSALFGVSTSAGAVDETFAPVAVISLPGGQKIQSFDISFVDPVIGIYILGDRTNMAVDVIDTTTNSVLSAAHGRIHRRHGEQRHIRSRRCDDRRPSRGLGGRR